MVTPLMNGSTFSASVGKRYQTASLDNKSTEVHMCFESKCKGSEGFRCFDRSSIFVSQSSFRFERFVFFKNTLILPHLVNKELHLTSAPWDMVAP